MSHQINFFEQSLSYENQKRYVFHLFFINKCWTNQPTLHLGLETPPPTQVTKTNHQCAVGSLFG